MSVKNPGNTLVTIENLIEKYQPEFSSVESPEMKEFLGQLQNMVASNNTLILKTVAELLPLSFFVDDYQRGYKWLPQQVNELLNDIHEFKFGGDDFYCLQPVVVKHQGSKGRWELIDGQQRITTVYMILSYLQHEKYSIDYRTRTSSSDFLQKYLGETLGSDSWDEFVAQETSRGGVDAESLDNVDNYHFYTAYKTIADWFSADSRFPEESGRNRWLDKLLHHTKVIWYAAREDNASTDKQQSIDIFMRINSGKIPLTNAELIKALFLHGVADIDNSELALLQQSEMAQQWDMIEHGLQNEEFWAFLSPSDRMNSSTTRIELLFDLISGKTKAAKGGSLSSQDKYYSFHHYSNQLGSAANQRDLVVKFWHEVKQGYYRLLEWYNDDELYHLTGFLISRVQSQTVEKIWVLAQAKNKRKFINLLKDLIAKELQDYFKSEDAKTLDFSLVEYDTKHRQKIISMLILLNIDVHRNNSTRLSFKTYRNISWDIEHIHAQNSKPLDGQSAADLWKVEQETLLASVDIPEGDTKYLKGILGDWDVARRTGLKDAKTLRDRYLKKLAGSVGEFKDEKVNSLDNLCLLSDSVNRGIRNEIFSVKRQMIINYEKGDEQGKNKKFIPIATKNVFSKFYSENVSQMHKWSDSDRQAYRNALIASFTYYGPMEGLV
tara:strand:- start:6090 stop:8081 length:1992 start_codon:yes stop_codon:yes gene_type:complete